MAAFRRGVFCIGLSYASNLVRLSGALVRRQVMKFPTTIRKNWISLSAIGGLCAVPFSQTTLALVDSFTQYVKTIHTLMTIHKHYVASVSKLTPAEEDSVWQVIVRQRQEVSDLREDCKRFESNWMMAINLSKLAAETAYNAAQTSLQVAQSHVDQIRQLSMEAEKNLKESNAEDSQRIKLPAAMEEEDIPEAYLRED
ncbi:unnamed protein product [Coregonus sp. 'balchen']|nr:unnamed protein product [Coregonus sp. 'balchen']